MILSSTTLLGNSLVFDGTGQTLIAVDPDAISVIELGAGGQTTRLPIRYAHTVAAFADQLWIAIHDDQLAPCGPAAAVWSSNPALALIADFGQLAVTEIAEVDLPPPLTGRRGRRFITTRGAKLTLPSGLATKLPPNTTVLAGAVMADGKSVTLLVAHAGSRQLVTVLLGTGQTMQRCAAPSPRSGSRPVVASQSPSSSGPCCSPRPPCRTRTGGHRVRSRRVRFRSRSQWPPARGHSDPRAIDLHQLVDLCGGPSRACERHRATTAASSTIS